jgi:DNA-binding phage protein
MYSMQGIFYPPTMERTIEALKRLLVKRLPKSQVKVDEPERAGGNYWVDVRMGRTRHTLEYRPGEGFGLFHEEAGFGEGPAEIYRTPERAVERLAQLMASGNRKSTPLGLKEIRELYGQSQVALAKKTGVRQPAISRFEKRGKVKLSTLATTIKALGGKLEVRARFSDADLPISLSNSKG